MSWFFIKLGHPQEIFGFAALDSSETTRETTFLVSPKVEDIVQSILKDMEILNWMVPLMIGAADMAK